jgi:hypothetical protein
MGSQRHLSSTKNNLQVLRITESYFLFMMLQMLAKTFFLLGCTVSRTAAAPIFKWAERTATFSQEE